MGLKKIYGLIYKRKSGPYLFELCFYISFSAAAKSFLFPYCTLIKIMSKNSPVNASQDSHVFTVSTHAFTRAAILSHASSLSFTAAAVLPFLLKMCSYSPYTVSRISISSGVKYAERFLCPVSMVNHRLLDWVKKNGITHVLTSGWAYSELIKLTLISCSGRSAFINSEFLLSLLISLPR